MCLIKFAKGVVYLWCILYNDISSSFSTNYDAVEPIHSIAFNELPFDGTKMYKLGVHRPSTNKL